MQDFSSQIPKTPDSDTSKKGSDGISQEFLYDSEKQLLDSVIDFLPPQMKSFHMGEIVNNLKKG